jgi:hypothetical protein
MSNTLTISAPAGTINPITGHVNDDDAALFRAIGPDQPDPPSVGGTDRTTHVPFVLRFAKRGPTWTSVTVGWP